MMFSRRKAIAGGIGLGLSRPSWHPDGSGAQMNGDVIQPVEPDPMAAEVALNLLGSTPLVEDLFPRECDDLAIASIELPDDAALDGLIGSFAVTDGGIGHDPDDAIAMYLAFATPGRLQKAFDFAIASSDKSHSLEVLGHRGAQLHDEAGKSQLMVIAGTVLVLATGRAVNPNGHVPSTPGMYLIEPSPPRTLGYLAGALHHLDTLAIVAASPPATPEP